jgi:hypothetical protein
MKNTHLIWIPSLQTNIRFKELDNSQYRTILKNVNDESHVDFIYNLNEILKNNIVDNIEFNDLTILDRFIIIIYLKILCYGPFLELSKQCEECDNKVNVRFDLNNLLDILGSQVDRSFRTVVSHPAHKLNIICDLPTVRQEFELLLSDANNSKLKNIVDDNINKYLTGYIRGITVDSTEKRLDTLTPVERRIIVNKIPSQLILAVKSQFVDPLYKLFSGIEFLEMECKECKQVTNIKLETEGLLPLLKTLFQDNAVENVFRDYFNITSVGHMDASFIEQITPKELNLLIEFVKASQKKDEPINSSDNSVDLFADSSALAGNTRTTPSEFNGF